MARIALGESPGRYAGRRGVCCRRIKRDRRGHGPPALGVSVLPCRSSSKKVGKKPGGRGCAPLSERAGQEILVVAVVSSTSMGPARPRPVRLPPSPRRRGPRPPPPKPSPQAGKGPSPPRVVLASSSSFSTVEVIVLPWRSPEAQPCAALGRERPEPGAASDAPSRPIPRSAARPRRRRRTCPRALYRPRDRHRLLGTARALEVHGAV